MRKLRHFELTSATETAPSSSHKVDVYRTGSFLLTVIILYSGSMTTLANAAPLDAEQCLFYADFEEGVFPKAWKGRYEIKSRDKSLQISNDARSGKYAAQFTVREGDWVAGGTRSEATFDSDNGEDVEEWVAWSFMIPLDFKDSLLRDKNGKSNWQTIGQWHVQPDRDKGETWDTWSGKSSPSIALNYLYLDESDPRVQKMMHSGKNIPGMGPHLVNRSVIALSYGIPPKARALIAIDKGVWNDVKFHIRWSQGSNGFVEANFNGKSSQKIRGANMYNAASHYFKIGMYRSSSISNTNSVLYDDVCISRSPT